jgi:L-proline---[L-prolyl-carrier protein] ligase
MMNKLIHKSMLETASIRENSVALQLGEHKLPYRELANGSMHIASCLVDLDVTSEQCIGIYMGKCFESILSMYGVMMSGSAYVPLDIKNPKTRIQHIVNECTICTFITTTEYIDQLTSILSDYSNEINIVILTDKILSSESCSLNYITLDPLNVNNTDLSKINNINIDSSNLASVMYTSGSSGTPKGVMMTHASVMTFIKWVHDYFNLNSNDRCASHAPLHFDLSLLDIFSSHCIGATVVLIPDAIAGNPKYLAHQISRQKITIWQSVPSVLVMLLKYGNLNIHTYSNLRHVLFAGERMSTKNLKNISCHFNMANFHNIYGSTETNDTFIYSIDAKDNCYPDPLPIGKPLPYVDYKIKNINKKFDSELPEGELLVRTQTIMRGYKKNKHPRTSTDKITDRSQEYYPTGDLVKKLNDGNLLFCGRTDDIIKSSGFRINMLEIENILQGNVNISDVAVIPIPDDEIGNKIIAIVSACELSIVSAIELKVYCAQRLPKYAIPHIFEINTNPLPKTSSGKTNKQILIKSRSYHATKTKLKAIYSR